MTETPITSTDASAWFDACARTVIEDELVKEPSTSAFVSPLTSAIGRRTSIDTPPAAPPGAVACASFVAVAATSTAPVVEMSPVDRTSASVARPFSACAIVRPAARTPVSTLTVFALTVCVPSALTVTPPAPTVPWAPEVALVIPERVENATAPLMPAPIPASTAIASVGALIVSVAETVSPATGPPSPRRTLPTAAVASPLTLLIATDAPVVKAPVEPPSESTSIVRLAVVVTKTPPPA